MAGDVNVTGEIKANGVSGQNMQLLSSDGNGGMNWIDMNEYKYYFDVTSTTSTTWTVPAGVDKICVELWGAGGGGSLGGGGGAGGYLKAVVAVTEGLLLTLDVGEGGAGVSGGAVENADNGEFSQCSATGINLLALGGTGGKTTVPGTGGAFAFTAPESYIRLRGENGKPVRNRQVQISSTVFDIETTFGDGGSPPFFPRNGGQGELWQKSNANFLFQNNGTDGLQPGGGGGGGNAHNQSGGDGYIIIRW